jgi:hypothetical protein
VLPAWINRNPADNAFASNGDNPLNFVSHSRGSLQYRTPDFANQEKYLIYLLKSSSRSEPHAEEAGASPALGRIAAEFQLAASNGTDF